MKLFAFKAFFLCIFFIVLIDARPRHSFLYKQLTVRHIQQRKVPFKVLKGHTSPLFSIHITPDEKYIITESSGNEARVWNFQTGELINVFRDSILQRAIGHIPENHFILTGFNTNIAKVWDIESGVCLKELVGHAGSINTVVLSPSGRFIVTGSSDCSARIWEIISQDFDEKYETLSKEQRTMITKLLKAKNSLQICKHHDKWKNYSDIPDSLKLLVHDCFKIKCGSSCPKESSLDLIV